MTCVTCHLSIKFSDKLVKLVGRGSFINKAIFFLLCMQIFVVFFGNLFVAYCSFIIAKTLLLNIITALQTLNWCCVKFKEKMIFSISWLIKILFCGKTHIALVSQIWATLVGVKLAIMHTYCLFHCCTPLPILLFTYLE